MRQLDRNPIGSLRHRVVAWPAAFDLIRTAEVLFLLGAAAMMVVAAATAWRSPEVLRGHGAYTQLLALSCSMLAVAAVAAHRQRRTETLPHLERIPDRGHLERKQKHYDQILAILGIVRIMGTAHELKPILDGITHSALKTYDAEQTSILLLDETSRELVVRSASGMLGEGIVGLRQPLGHGIAGKVATSGEPQIIGFSLDPERIRDAQRRGYTLHASMVVPIRLREEMIGVLCVGRRNPGRTYETEDLHMLLVFAEVVAICIRRTQQAAWLREKVERLEAVLEAYRRVA